jgi:hypothetical protein
VTVPTWVKTERAVHNIKRQLKVQFAMDIIILMCWSIWKERNSWIFNNEDPQVANSLVTFKKEFVMVIHRAKSSKVPQMDVWFSSLT